MAALIGSPLSRYQPMAVSRWLLMASAATFSAPTWATALAITASEAVTSASPDCSTQPSRGVWIASGCEEFDDNFAPAIQHHRFGVGGAFIEGNDELFCCRLHRALLGHSVSRNREDEEYLPPSPASVQAML